MIGMNQQNMNGINKYILLKNIIINEPISRIELSHLTGLSKMTVTGLIKEYMDAGIVQECGMADSTGGRRRTYLQVAPESLLTLGIHVGRDNLNVGIINLKGQIIQSESMELSAMENNDIFLKGLFLLCDRLMQTRYREKVWGIGISCAGPLLVKDGVILNPPDFNNIRNLPIVSCLEERYDLPAYLQNDICVAALAEVYFGNRNQYDDFIYVGISAGIGGGVIMNGKLYTGFSGLAGIMGHTIVEKDGILCECGQRGCLEMYSSTRAVVKWARENGAGKDLTWMELLVRASSGDEVCMKAVERMTGYLEVAFANMANAYDTQCFIIGGDLHIYQEKIVKRLEEKLRSKSFSWGQERNIHVESSSFIGSASFIGTVALVLENNSEV
ncbi:MAG: ROK family protein [Lachnospiraceae bacterium]|nr:ROK family protein [Lachnospiraceae bacterium]